MTPAAMDVGGTGQGSKGQPFAALASTVRAGVEEALGAVFGQHRTAWVARFGAASEVVTVLRALEDLALRGGKRFRAVLVAAAYEACGGQGGPALVLPACAAIELLQTYLLVHDDWMDEDDVRRGGPSVHAALRRAFASPREGDVAAILAGDFASGMAQRALSSVKLPDARVLEAVRVFAGIQEDVVLGQLLDVRKAAGAGVEVMHDLKTGSYTTRGPLLLGAALAGASAEQNETLVRFARPLGVAFQLRDDLLGTFGDPARTGKPRGGDLRQGKRTSLVIEAEADPEAASLLAQVLGREGAEEAQVAALASRMVACGARARVEGRLSDLLASARGELARGALLEPGRAALEGAVDALGQREH